MSVFNFSLQKQGTVYTIFYDGEIIKKVFATQEEAYQWIKVKIMDKYPLEMTLMARLLYEVYNGV